MAWKGGEETITMAEAETLRYMQLDLEVAARDKEKGMLHQGPQPIGQLTDETGGELTSLLWMRNKGATHSP